MIQTELQGDIRIGDVNLGVIFLEVMDEAVVKKASMVSSLEPAEKSLSHFLHGPKGRSLHQGVSSVTPSDS